MSLPEAASKDDLFRLAREALDRRDYVAAAEAATQCLARAPKHGGAYRILGKAHLALGEVGQAIQAFAAYCQLRPGDGAGFYDLASAELRAGAAAGASASFSQSLALVPGRPEALLGFGRALVLEGRGEEALPQYDAYLAARPADMAARFELMRVQIAAGRSEEALASGAHLLAAPEPPSLFHRAYAKLLRDRARHEEALPHFARYAAVHPEDVGAEYDLAQAFLAAEKPSEAEAAISRAITLAPQRKSLQLARDKIVEVRRAAEAEAAALHDEAVAQLRAGDAAAAIIGFRRAAGLRPDRPDTHLNLARALVRAKHEKDAAEPYAAFLAMRPTDPTARFEFLRLLVKLGRMAEAVEIGAALMAQPEVPAAAHREYAKALRGERRFAEAARYFATYAESKPDDVSGHHDLARALLQSDQPAAAEEALRRGLALAPERHSMHLDLGRALTAQGMFDEAIDAYRGALAAGGDVNADLELSRALVRQDKHRLAIAHLKEALERRPGEFRLPREVANIQRQLGKDTAADTAFRQASEMAPTDAGLWHDYGRFHLAGKRYKKALRILRQVEAMAPRRPGLRRSIAECLIALDEPAEAEALLRQSIAAEPDNMATYADLIGLLSQMDQPAAAGEIFERAVAMFGEQELLLREQLRAKLRLRAWSEATPLLERILAIVPDHLFALLQTVRIAMTTRRYDRAKAAVAELLSHHPTEVEALYELGRVSMETAAPERAREVFAEIISRNPGHHQSYYRLAQLATRDFDLDTAVEQMSQALTLAPENTGYLLDRGRLWLSINQLDRALEDAERVLVHQPANQKAAQIASSVAEASADLAELRVSAIFLCRADEMDALGAELADVGEDLLDWQLQPLGGRSAPTESEVLQRAMAVSPKASWIAVGGTREAIALVARLRSAKQRNALKVAEAIYGTALLRGGAGKPAATLYRREMLQFFVQVATARGCDLAELLRTHHDLIRGIAIGTSGTVERMAPPRAPAQEGSVFLVSRHGIELYGGGEHFLRGMGKLYREKGFTPVIIGMRSDMTSLRQGEEDGFAFADLPASSAAILDFALSERPSIVHLLSGLGYEIITPLKFLHIATIYGTHFWRDMFEEIGGYRNLEENAVSRREFNQIIRNTGAIYSNSNYTDEIKRQYFAVSTPVIYSLNDDSEHAPPEGGRYALLVNARPEKGFDLLLKVAALAPEVPFLAIASQSPVAQAEEAVAAAGLTNVTVIGKTAGLDEIYRQTRVVLVPSYAFRETFSRVVIEAHRHGLPVVGSDQGNVPYLLVESGLALPEEPEAWAAELSRLYADEDYYATRRRLAIENSERYAFSGQAARLGRLIGYLQQRILVGVGAGIGNIVQTAPLIRRLAEHYGRPVDVVVNQDFPDCALLLAGNPHVNMVFTPDRNVTRREYDLVYLSHSFGSLIPSFNSNRVIAARNHYDFLLTRDMHESLFNLWCAKELLGVPYEEADAADYFVGRYSRPAVGRRYIGIHSGGKGGEWEEGSWLNKRWPYYRELVAALKERGYEVASFGVTAEYVEGTVNLTGTPLAETIRNIGACEYFIGNDSGLMHVADGLGVPLTTIFGPTSVVKNGPLASTSHVIELKKDCAPCQFDQDRFASCVCIAEVGLERVLVTVLGQLAARRGSTGRRRLHRV